MANNASQKVIFLATGGTGGHIFPAKALGAELQKRGYKPVIISDERFLKYATADEHEYMILPVKQPKGGITGKITAGLSIIKSYFQARGLVKKYKPLCAVGFGGYPSFPTILAASQLGVSTIIHEQNSLLGKANEVLLNSADALATSFPEVVGIKPQLAGKVVYTGNPVREEIKNVRDIPHIEFNGNNELHILVTGGSQGANIFSRVVPAAIERLPDNIKKLIRIDQQARSETVEQVRDQYSKMNVQATVQSFFSDMPERLKNNHIMIARSGASTLSEAGVAGRPVIMVPLANSKGNHQYINAKSFEATGGGITIQESEFTAEKLAESISNIFSAPENIKAMSANAKNFGVVDAEKNLADLVEKVIKP